MRNRHRLRVTILLVSMFFLSGALAFGSSVSLTSEEADLILGDFPAGASWDSLAFHNMRASMFYFLPPIGIIWAGSSGFVTGIALKAIAMSNGESAIHLFLRIAIFPHYWLEMLAYSLALTAGLMLLLSFLTVEKAAIMHEMGRLAECLAAWAGLLIFAGVLEVLASAAFFLWLIMIPLAVVALETLLTDSFTFSRKAVLSLSLLLYLSVFIVLPGGHYFFPVAMYVVLGYYLAETLANGWLRSQTQKLHLGRKTQPI